MFFNKYKTLGINVFFLIFLTLLVLSSDLINFFISWVGLNITLYGILLSGYNIYKNEITLKYFLSGSIITIFLLMSISIFYVNYGTFNFFNFSYIHFKSFSGNYWDGSVSSSQRFSIIIIILCVLFKLGAFPFHFYLGDIYEGLDIKKNMFLYTIPLKVIVFILLIKISSIFAIYGSIVDDILKVSAIGSISASTFNMLWQKKLRRFWAYSYLNSIGFSIVSLDFLEISKFTNTEYFSGKVYFLVYIFTWFFIYEIFYQIYVLRNNTFMEFEFISDLKKFSNKNYQLSYFTIQNKKTGVIKKKNKNLELKNYAWKHLILSEATYFYSIKTLRFLLLLLILSLMGLPPFLGFYSKALLYSSLLTSKINSVFLFWILAISPVAGLSYLRLIMPLVSDNSENINNIKNKCLHISSSEMYSYKRNVKSQFFSYFNSKFFFKNFWIGNLVFWKNLKNSSTGFSIMYLSVLILAPLMYYMVIALNVILQDYFDMVCVNNIVAVKSKISLINSTNNINNCYYEKGIRVGLISGNKLEFKIKYFIYFLEKKIDNIFKNYN